jgi:protein gp37
VLRRVPARVRFVSFEPLLGPIMKPDPGGIHWEVVGGESSPRSRPIEAWWVEEILGACKAQRVAFFFKQWGGKRKKKAGRLLAGRVWEEYPKRAGV